MSLSKRIWIECDPSYGDARQRWAEDAARRIAEFKFRLPMRRRNKTPFGPHWDSFWSSALRLAAEELGLEVIRVNDGICFRTREQRDSALELAQQIWQRHKQRTQPGWSGAQSGNGLEIRERHPGFRCASSGLHLKRA
jgi:hypothetical protein